MRELNKKIYPKSGMMSIGELSERSQVNIMSIRHYERLGLLPDPRLQGSRRYRMYSASYVSRLMFIRKTRELGFSLSEIKKMIKWSEEKKRFSNKKAKKIYKSIDLIEAQIVELRKLKRELKKLVLKKL